MTTEIHHLSITFSRLIRAVQACAFLLLACVSGVEATHIVGGEIAYECLGNNEYRITLDLYRDCILGEADFDDPATISVFDASGNLINTLLPAFTGADILPVVINNPCLQAPPDVCVDHTQYSMVVELPFINGGYQMAYQRCCRNESIINLNNPGDVGSTYYLRIPEEALNSCNSSPKFNHFPPVALCVGDTLMLDQSATDLDGDQLVYALCDPFHGASAAIPAPDPDDPPPYQIVDWAPGYSAFNPMDANPQLSIDPVTGLMTGVPTQVGQYVVGVCVEEYRNGVLLGVNKRDFQFNVVNCGSFVDAIIADLPIDYDPCDGLSVDFGNNSINGVYWEWDFGIPGTNSDFSIEESPTFTFPDSGTYEILLIANPGYPCADSTTAEITVYNPVEVNIPVIPGQCFDINSFDFTSQGQYGSGAQFDWSFGAFSVPPNSTDWNPTGVELGVLGPNEVILTITDHVCSDTDTAIVTTHPRPEAHLGESYYVGCDPFRIDFDDLSTASTPLRYLWEFGTGHTSIHSDPQYTYNTPGVYDLTLTVWTTSGCVDTSTVHVPGAVTVNPTPDAEFEVTPREASIFEPHFQFFGLSDSITQCILFTDDGEGLVGDPPDCDFEYTYQDTGWYLPKFYVVNEFGCVDSTRHKIRVNPEFRFWIANSFTPNGDGVNDRFAPTLMGVKEYDFRIFNRWGQLVFQTQNPRGSWDGRVIKGNPITPTAVFAYRILLLDVFGEYHNYFGHVTSIR